MALRSALAIQIFSEKSISHPLKGVAIHPCKLSHEMGWRLGLKPASRGQGAKDRTCFLHLHDIHFTGITQHRGFTGTGAEEGPSGTPEWLETDLAPRVP